MRLPHRLDHRDESCRRPALGALLALASLAGAALAPGVPLALDPTRGLAQYVHDRFTDRQGLPQNGVRAILSSRRGDLWVGTDEGLARFDGVRFTTFDRRTSPALGSNLIYSLAEDAAGAIWIGTLDAGLYRLEEGRLSAARLPAPLPSPQITALADDGRGTLWIGTRKGLARLSDGTLAIYAAAEGLPDPQVQSLALGPDGVLLVGTARGGAALVEGGVRPGPAALAGVPVLAVTADPARGETWYGTEGKGVARVSRDGSLTFLAAAEGVPASVSQLYLDRDGTMWLGGDEGLFRLRGRRAERRPPGEGSESVRVWSLAEDREGNLWIGSEGGGLERLHDGDFVTVGAPEGLPQEFATAVLQDASGDLWIGTFGGLAVAPGGDLRQLRTVLRGRRQVLSLADDRHGTVWIGFVDGGLSRVRRGVVQEVTPASPSRSVSALSVAPDGTLLAGTFKGLFRLEGSRLVPEAAPGLPAGTRVNALAWAGDGALWAGLEFQGAYRRPAGGSFERIVDGPPPGRDVNDVLVDQDGTVWLGTLGDGLWRWRAGHAAGVTTRSGLFDDVIWRILDDRRGNLWLACNKGLFRVSRAELDAVLGGQAATVTSTAYGAEDGMRSRECNGGFQPAGWRTSDGRLWVPTVKGLSVVDPARLKPDRSPPVVIDQLAIDGQGQANLAAAVLPAGAGRLVVGYSALAFSAPGRVRYRYRLEGLDRDWIDAADQRVATYTNLAPGQYRLQVQARLGQGFWGTPAELSIEQLPTLTQRPWFWPLVATALLAATGLAFVLRARQHRASEAALRASVQQALAELRRAQELLPICAWCKKVRDDEGYWKKIEVYLHDRGVADVTHGMCPECLARYETEGGGAAEA